MKSAAQLRNAVRLSLESLEPRYALAGNIAASLVGDTLSLSGDRFDNDAIVTVRDGLVHIGSIKNTTINGAASLSLNVDPTRLDLVIDGEAGNDQLWVNVDTTNMTANLTIRGGDGNDSVAVVPTSTSTGNLLGNVSIDAGKGDDFVDLGIDITGDASIIGGVGGDQVNVRDSTITGRLHIGAGDGNDRVSITVGTAIGGALTLDGGKGRDLISLPSALAAEAFFSSFEDIRLL